MGQEADLSGNSRRQFLFGSLSMGAVLAATGCAIEMPEGSTAEVPTRPTTPTGSGLLDGLDEDNFIVHSRGPWALETKRDRLGTSVVTSKERLFVRCNLPMPPQSIVDDRDGWEFIVNGVANPGAMTVGTLKKLGLDTVAMVLQCSGNGRKFFAHETSGSQWGTGAAGCVVWSGVRVSRLIEAMGGATGGNFLTTTGGEELPEGVDPLDVVVERSIPLEKGLDDALLAWEMNGEPINVTHGGPLRLIVPGYYGCNNIKYVKQLAITAEASTAKIMDKGYRYREIGEGGAPSQPSMWQMTINSWICSPSGQQPVLPGKQQVSGVAFSGGEGVSRVEWSFDGQNWNEAAFLGPDMGRYAWRMFSFEVDLSLGEHAIYTRAVSEDGQVQPEARAENHRGYGHNGWRDHGVIITASSSADEYVEQVAETVTTEAPAPGSVALSSEGEAGRELFVNTTSPTCGTCHTLGEAGTSAAVGPNFDVLRPSREQIEAAVRQGVGIMPSFESSLTEDQIKSVATYILEVTGS